MKNNSSNIRERIEKEFISIVRQPSRYIGGEWNQVKKDHSKCDLTMAICFPDVYEVAMSNTGISILYSVINELPWAAAERVFSPWIDAEKILREKNIPLYSLETRTPLEDFDIIGFSITNELCYTNVLNALDLAGLEVRSQNRSKNDPLIIAGGSMANCCEPIADFIDAFVLGEGEETVVELLEFIKDQKKQNITKNEILINAAKNFNWLYVPSLYNFEFSEAGIKSITPKKEDLLIHRKNAVVDDFENSEIPLKPVVPFPQAIHERISIEVMRGCPGQCAFCQASFCRRPIRFRSPEKVFESAVEIFKNTGYNTVSLLSLSTADYPHLEELLTKLHEHFTPKHVGVSIPSLRVDQQLQLLPKMVDSVRKGGLTIAVEAASERLRDAVHKPLKNEDLFSAIQAAYKAGWNKVKLYFMAGLPGETEEDIKEIVNLCNELAILGKKTTGKITSINAAISWLVPKPHTPLSWMGQKSTEYFQIAKKIILDQKYELNARYLNFKFHEIERSVIESAIGRGDRRLSNVIEQAWKNGARFDLWSETFDYKLWQTAFEKFDMSIDQQAQRSYDTDQILPWQHLGGPDTNHLLDHYKQVLSKI